MKWLLLIAVLVVVAAAVYWWAKHATYHFAVVQKGVLYRDGNRGLREFENAIRKGSIKTVVMLIDDGELSAAKKPEFAAEVAWAKERGLSVERIPIPLGGWPTEEDVSKFIRLVVDEKRRPVLVHCAQGVRRTGMLVAAYQQSVLGYDDARATAEMLTFGHSQRTVGDVQRFIDGYDPKTGAVPEGLPRSKE